jgi:hypothetical protein
MRFGQGKHSMSRKRECGVVLRMCIRVPYLDRMLISTRRSCRRGKVGANGNHVQQLEKTGYFWVYLFSGLSVNHNNYIPKSKRIFA